jgi:Fe-S cluster assembly protein SufD
MNPVKEPLKINELLLPDFKADKTAFHGNGSIAGIRKEASALFLKNGIPNSRNEEYKYSNPEKILADFKTFSQDEKITLTSAEVEPLIVSKKTPLIVLVNGVYSESLSRTKELPSSIYVSSLSDAYVAKKELVEKHYARYASSKDDSFVALNTASANNGIFIHASSEPLAVYSIQLLNILTADGGNKIVNPRTLILVDAGSRLNIIETSAVLSKNRVFNNNVTEVVVNESAQVDHYKIQNESDAGYGVHATHVFQKNKSVYNNATFTLSGSFVRNNLSVVLDDENCEAHLNGLYLLNGTEHVDNHTLVDHRKPHCQSNELYKGIIDGQSNAVFNGKIYVRQDAQKTNAFQSNKNVLLSSDATINTKPQLEIYANDVKCSHGTSTGQMDEEGLFYLRSRGISKANAKKLMMHAFAEEVVDRVKIDFLKDYIEHLIEGRFN